MRINSNTFEKRWAIILLACYVIIMIPFPWYFSKMYHPSIAGLPSFIVGWLLHGLITMGLFVTFAVRALRRPEYQDESKEYGNGS